MADDRRTPVTVPALSTRKRRDGAEPIVMLTAYDTPGARIAGLTANRVVYRDGLPVASLSGRAVQLDSDLAGSDRWEAERRLLRSSASGLIASLA